MDVHDLGHRDDHHGTRLSVRAGRRHRSAAPRDPPQHGDPDEVRADGPFMTELYPTNIRGTGQGFCYNAGRAIGSVFMTAIGFATAVMPLGTAIALFSTLAHALMIVMLLLLPETRGRAIASLEPEVPGAAAYPSRSAV